MCTASVEYEGDGYDAFFGWIQMVRSTDNHSGGRSFEMDPLGWFPDSRSPYAFFGMLPTLFDAPSRGKRRRMSWEARSFLATTPIYNVIERILRRRLVLPVTGFSWGFDIDDQGEIRLREITEIGVSQWVEHLDLLRRSYRTWRFPPGRTQ